jgi:hypothetical protein
MNPMLIFYAIFGTMGLAVAIACAFGVHHEATKPPPIPPWTIVCNADGQYSYTNQDGYVMSISTDRRTAEEQMRRAKDIYDMPVDMEAFYKAQKDFKVCK